MRNPISILTKSIASLVTGEPARSSHWSTYRRHHLAIEGWCRGCGGTKNLEVHHVVPFHIYPARELDPTNYITLCEAIGVECHLKKGHLGNWKNFNPNVRTECIAPQPLH